MSPKAKRNLHVPLPEPLHEKLRREAARSGLPATVLAREAIEAWLEERRRLEVHDAVAEYAKEMAGGRADLDEELERAGIEHLTSRRRKQ